MAGNGKWDKCHPLWLWSSSILPFFFTINKRRRDYYIWGPQQASPTTKALLLLDSHSQTSTLIQSESEHVLVLFAHMKTLWSWIGLRMETSQNYKNFPTNNQWIYTKKNHSYCPITLCSHCHQLNLNSTLPQKHNY